MRNTILPYGKHVLDEQDVQSVVDVLKSDHLTTGPKLVEFEDKCKSVCNSKYALVVNSGTAALHCAIAALDLQKEDQIIVSGISFVASANCVVYCGGVPIFCDVDPETLNIDIDKIAALITEKTKGIVVVDFAGQVVDYHRLQKIVKGRFPIIQDAAHSFGLTVKSCTHNVKVGQYADITTSSFHPVKNITTGEGGIILTNSDTFYKKMKLFRNHGVDRTHTERNNGYYYEMVQLGYNYRIPDILCALGCSQIDKVDTFIEKRQYIAKLYDTYFETFQKSKVTPLKNKTDCAYHIYVIKVNEEIRDSLFEFMKEHNIGVNVHYLPIHLHPFYKDNYKTCVGQLPVSELVYKQLITLPIHVSMNKEDVKYVCDVITNYYDVYLINLHEQRH
eukprot:gene12310-14539_t